MLIFRASREAVELVETAGMWIGVLDDIGDLLRVDTLSLNPGDALLLFTDGITEAVDNQGQMFSGDRLAAVLKENGTRPAAQIQDAILQAIKGSKCEDDITFLVAKKR